MFCLAASSSQLHISDGNNSLSFAATLFTQSSFAVGLFWACIQPMTISIYWAKTVICAVRSANVVGLLIAIPLVFLPSNDRGVNSNSYSSSPDSSYSYLMVIIHKNVAPIPLDLYGVRGRQFVDLIPPFIWKFWWRELSQKNSKKLKENNPYCL